MIADLDELSARDVLLAVEETRVREMSAQADLLRLAAHWCDLHGPINRDAQARVIPGSEKLVALGGPGTPEVEEFAAAEFGVMRHLHPMAARNLMADALDLRHRLPSTWTAVHALRLEVWVACKIASCTRKVGAAAARYVDDAIAPVLESLPAGRLLALVEAKVIEADPEKAEAERRFAEQTRFVRTTTDTHGLKMLIARASAGDVVVFEAMVDRIAEILGEQGDQDAIDVRRSKAIGILARPAGALRLLLEAAVADGVPDEAARAEVDADVAPDAASEPTGSSLLDLLRGMDPATLRPRAKVFVHLTQDVLTGSTSRVARVEGIGPATLGQVRDWLGHAHVELHPVLDLSDQRPVDGYEFPPRLKESLHQLQPAGAFPWAVNTSRHKDIDHPVPYLPPARGGPPGQTGLHNAAPLTRHDHRIKTHGRWRLRQPRVGVYLWRSPHGFWHLVDHTGTHRLTDCQAAAASLHLPPRVASSPLEDRLVGPVAAA